MTDINDQLFDFWEADTLKVGHFEGRTLLSIKGYNFDMTDIIDPLFDFLEAEHPKSRRFRRSDTFVHERIQFRYDGHNSSTVRFLGG